MNKIFLSADDLLLDSYRLARQVYESGFRPDLIIGVWRGGAPVAIAVQEFLDYAGVPSDHIAIRASSYTGIDEQEQIVRVQGLHYIVENVNAEDQVLLVDDVFDSGRSLRATLAELRQKCRRNMPSTIRIACPWYKPNKNITDMQPDYFVHETDDWLVFPHELIGLSVEEMRAHKPELAALMDRVQGALETAGGHFSQK